jgi:hypothetical protein
MPKRKAWATEVSPRVHLRFSVMRKSSALLLHPPLESLYLTSGVHQALLAGEEWVTAGTDVHTQRLPRGARLPTVAATTGHGCFLILWMNSGLHDLTLSVLLCYCQDVNALTLFGGVVKHDLAIDQRE